MKAPTFEQMLTTAIQHFGTAAPSVPQIIDLLHIGWTRATAIRAHWLADPGRERPPCVPSALPTGHYHTHGCHCHHCITLAAMAAGESKAGGSEVPAAPIFPYYIAPPSSQLKLL